jgi:outer membrane protein
MSQKARIESLRLNAKRINSGYLPSLSLSASYGTSYRDPSSISGFSKQFFDMNPSFSTGLTLSIPIFDRFATKTQLAQTEINLHNQELTIQDLELSIRIGIEQAVLTYKTWIKQIEKAEAQVRFSEQTLKASLDRYKVGASTYNEVSQVRAQNVQARYGLISAKYNLLNQYFTVHYQAGDIDQAVSLLK